MDIRELFEELGSDGEPPMSLSADQLYAAGRRQSRVRRATVAGVALAAAALVALASFVLASPSKPVVPTRPTASARPERTAPSGLAGVLWADAADAQHLYVEIPFCPEAGRGCVRKLLGSDDGGRSWAERATPQDAIRFSLLPTGVLIALTSTTYVDQIMTNDDSFAGLAASTDGGRHWRTITLLDTTIPAVPPGGVALCLSKRNGNTEACRVVALDLVHNSAAALATQPGITPLLPYRGGSRYRWVGPDPATATLMVGGLSRPAGNTSASYVGAGTVATSTDAGRTWTTTQIGPDCDGIPQLWEEPPGTYVAVCDIRPGSSFGLYRSADGGHSWQSEPVPAENVVDNARCLFLPDGTLVGPLYATSRYGIRLMALRGGAWHPVTTTGLADIDTTIVATVGGAFIAYGYLDGQFDLYYSSDLSRWTRIAIAH
jgi:photosystem II stability/assembly factor-like uncharacterized protein